MGIVSLVLHLLNLLQNCDYLLNLLTMRNLLLLALFCGLGYTMASPMLKELPKLGCSIDELLACAGEIEAAVEDCSHLTDVSSIVTCVNDILAATDCQKCVCDVVPFLCGQEQKIRKLTLKKKKKKKKK